MCGLNQFIAWEEKCVCVCVCLTLCVCVSLYQCMCVCVCVVMGSQACAFCYLSSVLGERYIPSDITVRHIHGLRRHSSGVVCELPFLFLV